MGEDVLRLVGGVLALRQLLKHELGELISPLLILLLVQYEE